MSYRVVSPEGEMRASVVYAEDAAVLVSVLGDGATIQAQGIGGKVLWTEGQEEQPAAESYDYVAEIVYKREEV